MQKLHQVVDPDHFELSMSIDPVHLVFLKVETIKGSTISIPFDPEQAIRMGISLASVGHAARRWAVNNGDTFDQDIEDLAALVNGSD